MNGAKRQGADRTPRGPVAYAGAGAVGGASFAAGIFGALGLAKILANTDGSYPPGYPIAVFGMVSLFILISAILMAPLSSTGAKFARFGVATFFVLTIVGASIFYFQTVFQPTAYVTESFSPNPGDFADIDSSNKLQLTLQYRPTHGSAKFEPYGDQRIPVNGKDIVELRLDGLDKLEAAYLEKYREHEAFRKELALACQGVQNNPVCFMVNAQMSSDQ
jgi:hypothetical protein